jgi:DNA polymerase-3 subunit chi
MTAIDFYAHVADPLRTVARIVVKAYRQNGSVRVLTPDAETTAALDRLLWQEPQVGFIPHCRLDSPTAAETPVLIDESLEHTGPAAVLINLRAEPPPFFSRFERLVEIVGEDEEQVIAGRTRFRFYRERGYELRTHKLSSRD